MQSSEINSIDKNLSDAEIVRRVASHDHAAFELLMRRYNQSLYRTARSILKDDAEAEDALQDAYILVYRGINTFRSEAKLLTWLTRIVINEAIAKSRKSNRQAEMIQLHAGADSIDDAKEVSMTADVSESSEGAVIRAQMRHLLETKIDALPDAFRTVFVLRALEEMTVTEVAICLDIPETTVRTRFFRARGLLREALAQEADFALEEAFSFDGVRCDRIVSGVFERLKMPKSDGA